jgi:broad specificity phosphatase PhoE
VSWVDARLVDAGIQQARDLGLKWSDAVERNRMPLPTTIYTSPLARCLETTKLVFSEASATAGRPFQPIVKELLRETMADHTCDHRSSRSWIAANYPGYAIEPGFTEEDELWSLDRSESVEEHVARKQAVLEDIFNTDQGQFLALTIHSGAISALMRACGSARLEVREGSTIAILLRGEKVSGGP